jgi:phospholipid transport system substrate-binding protein
MMYTQRIFGLLLFFMSTLALATELVAPDVLIKTTAGEVLEIIQKDKDIQSGNKKKIKDLIETKVLPQFDFTRMTRLAMGRFWSQATPAQQQELTAEFRSLLVRTYSASITNYKDQKIDYKPFKMNPGDTDVVVKASIVQANGRAIPIDYSLAKTPSGWKVYDISVDGVSLVVNYRSSFAQEIQQGGVAQLINTLKAKNIGASGALAASKKG